MSQNQRSVPFQYWSDPLCIWAYVGQSKLERILDEWGDRLEVEYRIAPVFGSIPWRFREGSWCELGPEGRRDATRRVASEHGVPDVSGDVWITDPPESSWSSGAAARAVLDMEERGEAPEGLAARYLLELRHRFFRDNQNICRRSVQLAVAEDIGVPVETLENTLNCGRALATLWEDENERERFGVRGSPTYVFDDGRAVIYGNFDFAVLHAVVEQLTEGGDAGGSEC